MTDTYDTSDPEIVERVQQFDKMWNDTDVNDLRQVLSTRAGRGAIWRIMGLCGIYADIPTDQDILRNLGKRDVGLQLQDWVFTSDDMAYTMMQNEAFSRDQKRKELIDG